MKKFTAILVLFSFAFFTDKTDAQSFAATEGYAEFVSNAPLLEFKGKSDHLHGLIDLDQNLVDFYIDLSTLDTGINLRNRHMRDSYLETDRCPFGEFTGELTSDFDPDLHEEQDVTVKGTFKMHCISHEKEISGTIYPSDDGLKVDASWSVLLDDYDIDRPRVVFYELADEQKVNISILLEPGEN